MDPAKIPLLLTRPAAANARFADQLTEPLRRRCTLVESPLLEIVQVDVDYKVGPEDAVIFTSSAAIPLVPPGQDRRAFCVGEATTATAHQAGWHAIFCGETSEALVAFLGAYPLRARMWHLAGRHTRGHIAERLISTGLDVTRVTVYDQELVSLNDAARTLLRGNDPVLVPLFSPRTASHFAQNLVKPQALHILALSPAVAEPLKRLDAQTLEIAENPTAEAMIRSLEKLVAQVSLG
ncbi:uroporphyrinogen III methyltransferase [Roseobacter cerasinus]|uniref:Uroporphyrinogen-III synthase n=1 Tax=Roseobacter cerasinus TaxID=2602289 RepID=A0A640VQL8_9RHOB|nr:uroporphyrinogen-III synthase [Roseobacter cerasinus]GFE49391.1 uroporphyrinogen III methyltransferase [Roseobacter cerasinus]